MLLCDGGRDDFLFSMVLLFLIRYCSGIMSGCVASVAYLMSYVAILCMLLLC